MVAAPAFLSVVPFDVEGSEVPQRQQSNAGVEVLLGTSFGEAEVAQAPSVCARIACLLAEIKGGLFPGTQSLLFSG
jgi:hypothetical protein